MSTKSFSYHELMSGKINRMRLEALAKSGKLNEETLARIGHVGRFYQRISKACPDPNIKMFSLEMSYKNSGTKPPAREAKLVSAR